MGEQVTYEVWLCNTQDAWVRLADGDEEQVFSSRDEARELARSFMSKSSVKRAIVIKRTLVDDFTCLGSMRQTSAKPGSQDDSLPCEPDADIPDGGD